MGIIAFIILGLLAGIIAKALLPGSDPGGFIITTIIGVVGALLGAIWFWTVVMTPLALIVLVGLMLTEMRTNPPLSPARPDAAAR